MIEGFDVEGVIMSKLRVLCFFFWKGGRGGLKSKSIVSREIDSGGFFFLEVSCEESCEIKGNLNHRTKICSRNTKLFQFTYNIIRRINLIELVKIFISKHLLSCFNFVRFTYFYYF